MTTDALEVLRTAVKDKPARFDDDEWVRRYTADRLTIPEIWQAWDEDLLTLGQTVAALAAHGVTV